LLNSLQAADELLIRRLIGIFARQSSVSEMTLLTRLPKTSNGHQHA
jgi:hypothetical protein